MSNEQVTVTQADREAAAQHAENGIGMRDVGVRIRAGEHDQHELIQAFARHRLASQSPSSDIEAERDRLRHETKAVWRCAVGDITGALDILKNRWANSKRKAEREAGATLSGVLDLIWSARSPAAGTYDEAAENGKALQQRVSAALKETSNVG